MRVREVHARIPPSVRRDLIAARDGGDGDGARARRYHRVIREAPALSDVIFEGLRLSKRPDDRVEHVADAAHALHVRLLEVPTVRGVAHALVHHETRGGRPARLVGLARLREALHVHQARAERLGVVAHDGADPLLAALLRVHLRGGALRVVGRRGDHTAIARRNTLATLLLDPLAAEDVPALVPLGEDLGSLRHERVDRARALAAAAGVGPVPAVGPVPPGVRAVAVRRVLVEHVPEERLQGVVREVGVRLVRQLHALGLHLRGQRADRHVEVLQVLVLLRHPRVLALRHVVHLRGLGKERDDAAAARNHEGDTGRGHHGRRGSHDGGHPPPGG
mmetsp:Transcript_46625/g.111059  ORF Transcript_46625/g.111059 Transcript_46625/m.111059 type:complete len:335 (-) Transcript_46625:49-1053(-)